ncbi:MULTISPECIES: hypothetical protein [Legionella]|uniref:Uncharacterized protein n=1 Tax=Legionella drozanskii LLAP-1 TaxID=1212489 RepID=A0A0W0SQQ2_9GAMM|nr:MULTISPECIES: hypothetical protein [Legionella]KTC85696.1 hypothetical protein Ldro_2021 [Legionella drozanskii LLAP-1]PJE15526.1 MAG: hypothetical protein CK430_04260 [Legionella sp.]
MPIDQSDLEKMYAQAVDDQFRSPVFSRHVDIAPLMRSIARNASRSLINLEIKEKRRNIYHDQALLIAYIEQEAASFYKLNGMSTAYLDEFIKGSRLPDRMEARIMALVTTHPEADSLLILKNAIYNILLTTATASRIYNQESASKRLNTLFYPEDALFEVPEISDEKLAVETEFVSMEKKSGESSQQKPVFKNTQDTLFGSKTSTKSTSEDIITNEPPKIGGN